MRAKLSRLAASVAARVFSTGDTELILRVRRCHVEFVVETLRRIYSATTFRYNDYTKSATVSLVLKDVQSIKLHLESFPSPETIKEKLTYTDTFDLNDALEWCDGNRDIAWKLISLLSGTRAIRRVRETRGCEYQKTPEFIEWLKTVQLTPVPDHIKKDREKF